MICHKILCAQEVKVTSPDYSGMEPSKVSLFRTSIFYENLARCAYLHSYSYLTSFLGNFAMSVGNLNLSLVLVWPAALCIRTDTTYIILVQWQCSTVPCSPCASASIHNLCTVQRALNALESRDCVKRFSYLVFMYVSFVASRHCAGGVGLHAAHQALRGRVRAAGRGARPRALLHQDHRPGRALPREPRQRCANPHPHPNHIPNPS